MNKFIKVLVVICLAILVSGCTGRIDKTDLMKSEQFCEDKLGIKYINITTTSRKIISCLNGESQYLDQIELNINKVK